MINRRCNRMVFVSVFQGAAEWLGSGETAFEELLSLLPLKTRDVECPK